MATTQRSTQDLEMVEIRYLKRESATSITLVEGTIIGYLVAIKPKTIHVAPVPNIHPTQAKCIRRNCILRAMSLTYDRHLPV